MHFMRRGTEERHPDHVDDADIVVQIGAAKTGLRAAHLVGANIRISHSPAFEALNPRHTLPKATNSQGKALEALSQMQKALSPKKLDDQPCGPETWSPYSPDDAYPCQTRLYSTADRTTLPCLRREPSDATLPAYYDPGQYPDCISQQTSASAVRGMALHKGAQTIIDDNAVQTARLRFSDAPQVVEDSLPLRKAIRRISTKPTTKSRTLDLVNLFPQSKSSGARFLPRSRRSRSPPIMADTLRLSTSHRKSRTSKTITSSTSVALHSYGAPRAANRASRPFDEAVLDQHKTNVRRPPKGIQNWFDAYTDDDDDDDDDEGLEGEVDAPEPQELPADDILPSGHTMPYRQMSQASDMSTNVQNTPHDLHHVPQDTFELQHGRLDRTNRSSRSDSIQSSHLGSIYHARHNGHSASNLGQESLVSLSGSDCEDQDEYGEEEDYETEEGDEDESDTGKVRSKLPAIRDSIFDDRNIMIANASTLDVVRVPKPTQLNGIRIKHRVASSQSSCCSSASAPYTQRRDKPLPLPPHQEQLPSNSIAADPATFRRLNGLSLESSYATDTTETSNPGLTAETGSTGTSYEDTATGSPQDGLQMVAITEEERMLLEIMRQKRVAMQQMSFTEGYQLALRTEQQRLAKRATTAEERVLKHFQNQESNESHRTSELSASTQISSPESAMRRQLSAIQKEQVDERFQLARFLDMSSGPAPLASHPPDAAHGERKPRAPSGEVLPATRYSPTANTTPATDDKAGCFAADEYDEESVRKRVKQFISSKGAPPPLDSNIRTMRRPVTRQAMSMSPSSVIGEVRAEIPPLPPRSPQRTSGHSRRTSNFTVSTLGLRRSSSSMLDDTKDRSPVSALSGGNYSTHQTGSSDVSPHQQVAHHDVVPRPLRPDRQTEHKLKKSPSQPQLNHASSVTVDSMPFNASSPFASLIDAAARVSVQHQPMSHIAPRHIHPRTASSTNIHASAQGGVRKIDITKNGGKQPILPRLDTMERMRDSRASMVSITSAGEEVLSAWAELGGGPDCLQTKVGHRMA